MYNNHLFIFSVHIQMFLETYFNLKKVVLDGVRWGKIPMACQGDQNSPFSQNLQRLPSNYSIHRAKP